MSSPPSPTPTSTASRPCSSAARRRCAMPRRCPCKAASTSSRSCARSPSGHTVSHTPTASGTSWPRRCAWPRPGGPVRCFWSCRSTSSSARSKSPPWSSRATCARARYPPRRRRRSKRRSSAWRAPNGRRSWLAAGRGSRDPVRRSWHSPRRRGSRCSPAARRTGSSRPTIRFAAGARSVWPPWRRAASAPTSCCCSGPGSGCSPAAAAAGSSPAAS